LVLADQHVYALHYRTFNVQLTFFSTIFLNGQIEIDY